MVLYNYGYDCIIISCFLFPPSEDFILFSLEILLGFCIYILNLVTSQCKDYIWSPTMDEGGDPGKGLRGYL